ncbi:MAG: HDIG domain-containing protein [Candidatus Sabulitectum sp.]|nr:HDIG domain-containing protein [Candidatus Sabulitectum sp.]
MNFLNRSISLKLLLSVVFSVLVITGFYFGFDSRRALSDRNLLTGEPVVEGIVAVHNFNVNYSPDELEVMADEAELAVPIFLSRNEQTGSLSSDNIRELILLATGDNELAGYFGGRVSNLYTTGIIDLEALRRSSDGSRAVIDDNPVEKNVSELFTLTEARDDIRLDLERRGVLSEKISVILDLIVPDLAVDAQAREVAVQERIANLPVVKREFQTGEEILPPGGLFTEEISSYWDAMVLSPLGSQGIIEHGIAKTALAALLLLLGFLYMRKEQDFFSVSEVFLLFTIWGLTMGLTILLFRSGVQELSIFSFTMLGASLTSVFFHSRARKNTTNFAWFLTAIFAAIFALPSSHPMATFFIGLIPACIVATSIKELSDIGTNRAMTLGMASSVGVYWLLSAAGSSGSMHFNSVIWIALLGLPLVVVGTVKVITHPLELLFHVATARTYERLGNDDHPLRAQLRRDARGTYNHSDLVAELASDAALELGADEKLTMIGGKFHDIGKLINPEMFIENITNPDENSPHNSMPPLKSARIIIDHVHKGVELAEKYQFPTDIKDIIEQHHGDTSARFFLEKARREVPPGGEFDEEMFHYHGPKPQSLEAALVMLADSVSSGVIGLGNEASSEEQAVLISRIIQERSDEGQFDECKLTESMLRRVAHVFLDKLTITEERVSNFPHGN